MTATMSSTMTTCELLLKRSAPIVWRRSWRRRSRRDRVTTDTENPSAFWAAFYGCARASWAVAGCEKSQKRRLREHLSVLWEQGVGSSNLFTPTNQKPLAKQVAFLMSSSSGCEHLSLGMASRYIKNSLKNPAHALLVQLLVCLTPSSPFNICKLITYAVKAVLRVTDI